MDRQPTVFVSGCFDLIHAGHLAFLTFAAQHGRLAVSVASDATLRALKREPVIPEHDRCLLVAALACVEEAFVCRGPANAMDCFADVRNRRPAVWVVNDDDPYRAVKQALAKEQEIRVVLYHRPGGESTTAIIERIQARKEQP